LKERLNLIPLVRFSIFIVCFLIPIFSIALAEDQTGSIIIASSPIDCDVLLELNTQNAKALTVKGGEITNQTPSTLNIKKTEFQVSINGIQSGTYPITFKRDDILLKSEVNIQAGKTSLIKGNFENRKVFVIPQVFIGRDGAPMVLIPEGEFQMGGNDGDEDEQPIHKVYTDAFYMDVYEVTNTQYKKFMEATGHKPPIYWDNPNCNVPDKPVVGVIWQDAVDYCKWVGKRLPTEAEWEKAARGGLEGKKYPWGDDERIEAPTAMQNPGLTSAYPVGCFAPNGYGLHDMERNAWEWCSDLYDEKYYAKSIEKNPQGPDTGNERVLRGGSWFSGIYTPLPVSYRYSFDILKSSILIGFRCVSQSIEPQN
jgi:formylglycine-generating enzyme required for sulfatase activity